MSQPNIDTTPRPFGGLPVDPYDQLSLATRLSGMNGRPFTLMSFTDCGQPGRRLACGYHVGEDVLATWVKRTRSLHPRPEEHFWIERCPFTADELVRIAAASRKDRRLGLMEIRNILASAW